VRKRTKLVGLDEYSFSFVPRHLGASSNILIAKIEREEAWNGWRI